ncbi:MAG: hypothetical protein V2A73_12930 [Pseudomonadota bacterium]
MRGFFARNRAPLLAFAIAAVIYGSVAGPRLLRRSSDPHFLLQAQAWLSGRLEIASWPAGADDPAKLEEVELKSGEIVRGRRISARSAFRVLGGREVPESEIARTARTIHYVSFPPFPALLFVPPVALFGNRAGDVALTVVLAALVPAFFLLLLRRLREKGLSARTQAEDLWLAVLLAFGTVFFFSAVQGRVWFTAHVVGALLCILYAWASVEAAHPLLAGLSLGMAFVTRTPMLFMFPLFVLEAWRVRRGSPRSRLLRDLIVFAVPIAAIGLLAAWYNYARFRELTEFGHSYLAVRQQSQIERFGLFHFRYLTRNLATALTLMPAFLASRPYISISGHGLAIWVTTPVLLLLLWPRAKGALYRPLLATVIPVAAWSLLYQNSGWLQFGYRFSLDYIVFLVLLLAVGGRRLGAWTKTLIIVGIVVNLFGAITFERMPWFYRADNATYECVVRH